MTSLNVHAVDVLKLNEYVGKYITLHMKSPQASIQGLVYTIDPVSECVILLINEDAKLSLSIVLKHAIEKMEIIDEMPESLAFIDVTSLFRNTTRHLPTEADEATKQRILKWLNVSQIPFKEMGEVIQVEGVSIRPPYTSDSCVSNNPIKLMSMQHLLKTMSELYNKKDPPGIVEEDTARSPNIQLNLQN